MCARAASKLTVRGGPLVIPWSTGLCHVTPVPSPQHSTCSHSAVFGQCCSSLSDGLPSISCSSSALPYRLFTSLSFCLSCEDLQGRGHTTDHQGSGYMHRFHPCKERILLLSAVEKDPIYKIRAVQLIPQPPSGTSVCIEMPSPFFNSHLSARGCLLLRKHT